MFKLLKNLTAKEWLLAIISISFIVVQVYLTLTMPDYMRDITTLVQTPGSEMSEILHAGGKMLLCALGALIAAMVSAVCAASIGTSFSATLRRRLFAKVQRFSMEEIGYFSTASLITRSTNDVLQVQMLIILGLQVMIMSPIMAVWAICKISTKQWEWTMSTAAAVGVLLIVVLLALVLALPKFRKLQQLIDSLNRVTRENLSGLRVVRAYNAEHYQEDKFDEANTNLTNTQLFAQRTMAFLMPSIQLIMNGLTLAIYWIGAVLIDGVGMVEKVALFSDMMVFSQYAIQVIMSFMMLVMIFMMLPRAQVAAARINEVLNTEPTIEDGTRTEGESDHVGEVVFKNVSFRYPDAESSVIENISFTAKKGETVAFIGATGCGKSTVVNLIPRFYDATEGEILVDGVNVKEYTQKALRDKIGYVSQKAILFAGTVRSNIDFGDNGQGPISSEQVNAAIATAQASEFVEQLEDGAESHVAQGGDNFSGGQKQRLSIARAVARHPEIFIFDDSFSALDYKTDQTLRATLKRECGDATRFIVAQRIGTIRDADQIIVLDEGRIVGQGTHESLIKTCEVYQQIALSQLSKEELA